MDLGIKAAIDKGGGNTLLYTALLSSALANCIPTVADSVFFWREQIDKQELEEGKITPTQYWVRNSLGYYSYTALWYFLVFGTVYAIGGTYQTKAKIILALLSGGAVVGIVAKNIQKDNEISKGTSTHTLLPDNTTVTTNTPPPVFGESTMSFPATNTTQTIMTIGGSAIGIAAVVHMLSGKPVYSIAAGILGGIGGYFADQQIQYNNKQ